MPKRTRISRYVPGRRTRRRGRSYRRRYRGAGVKTLVPKWTRKSVSYAPRLSSIEKLRSLMGECKFHDTRTAFARASTTGICAGSPTTLDLSQVATGDSRTTRTGDVIYPKVLEYALQLGAPGNYALSLNSDFVRVIFYQWITDDNASAPTSTQLLEKTGTGETFEAPLNVVAPYNLQKKSWKKIIKDFKISLMDSNGDRIGEAYKVIRGRLRIPVQRIRYNGSASTLGYNKIFVTLMQSTGALKSDANCTDGVLATRLWYRDS